MKKQATDWMKISVKHIPDKGLLNKIYEELPKLNTKKINSIKNYAKQSEQKSHQRRHSDGK